MSNKKSKVCPYCGEEINHKAIFCDYCGMELNNEPQIASSKNRIPLFIVVSVSLLIVGVGLVLFINRPKSGPEMDQSVQDLHERAQQVKEQAGATNQTGIERWLTLIEFRGEGIKETENFTTNHSEWRISWRTYDELLQDSGYFIAMVHDANSGSLISSFGNVIGVQEDYSYVRTPPGNYYLSINSANIKWDIVVEEPQ